MGMIDEYFNYYNTYTKEYGDKCVILMAVGSFYEVYSIDNENEQIGNAKELSQILNMKYANKNGSVDKSSRSYPNFIGFTTTYLPKYLPILLENDYTVVIVDQLEESSSKTGKLVKRGVTAIHSPSIQPPDLEINNGIKENIYTSIILEFLKGVLLCSIVIINNSTNEIEIFEKDYPLNFSFNNKKLENNLEDINRIIYRYLPREINIFFSGKESFDLNLIKKFFEQNYTLCKFNNLDLNNETFKHLKDYTHYNFQNEYFKKVYSHINFGIIDSLEYLKLDKYPLSILNLMLSLDHLSKHDLKYIKNLSIPKFINEDSNNLILELNTLSQLSIINQNGVYSKTKPKSVFEVIDFTSTNMGKRYLKSILIKPFKKICDIQKHYNLTDELNKIDHKSIEKLLLDIPDIEKLHRKMGLEILHPYEFEKLHKSYHNFIKIIEIINHHNLNLIELNNLYDNSKILKLKEYISNYTKTFNLDLMKDYSLNSGKDQIENYFNKGIIKELDEIQNTIINIENDMEKSREYFNSKLDNQNNQKDFIKLNFTDAEGYHFTTTKIRYNLLLKQLEKDVNTSKKTNFTVRFTSNTCKFYTDELFKMSQQLTNYRTLLFNKIKLCYTEKLKEYYIKYIDIFEYIKQFIEIIDVTCSNLKCSQKYNYCKPEIIDNQDSFFKCKEIRHPIIERLSEIEYVTNDIILDNKNLGILLYGLNSCGKSSMLRAIGVNIVLAQAGLFVPCKQFQFSPFHHLISQVDFSDDIFKNRSSFINEALGLKKILECSGKNTLVLCDEALKTTEYYSAQGIVSSTILKLLNSKTKFFFTTHLHELSKIKQIKESKNLQICHLSISIKNDNVIFERKLQPGNGSELYGLEIIKSIIDDTEFIDTAFQIRNKITNNKTKILSQKKSRYNKQKIMDCCEICGNTNNLETDHIIPQELADENNFIPNGYHKNTICNLATLCKNCHLKKTKGEIVINGYKQTLSGKILDYSI